MGVVYAARDERLERTVALKTISAVADSDIARKRFWREARVAASVNHPNICQIHEISEDGPTLFIAMELLEGESLADRFRRGALPLSEALEIILGTLAALSALHGRGMVHRDVKPSNVFITPHGVKLLDFGLARHNDMMSPTVSIELTQPGMAIGTPRYMAPEQLSEEDVTARADLFAVGAILFEALAGRPAFGGRTIVDVLHATLHEQPPALTGSPGIAAVDRVIRRALAKRPDERFETADEMADELRELRTGGDDTPALARALTRVVVLPFRVLRPDTDIEFLTFSLPDAIATSLSGVGSLVVRSSATAARFAGETPDLKALASEAGVDRVVMGTLLRSGDQVRAMTQLVEAPGGTLLASHTIDSNLGELFALQDDIARRVANALTMPLTGDAMSPAADAPRNPRAYEFYLRANQVSHDHAMLPVAGELYRSALDEDPQYAPAWAKLGRVYRVLAKYGGDDATENLKRADEAFQRAMLLNPDLSVAHNLYTNFEVESLGRAKEAMARLLTRARSQTDPEIFTGLVIACRFCGLLDASLAADRQARRLDPTVRTSVMYTHFMLGDWERALASDTDSLKWVTNWTLPLVGRQNEAIASYQEMESRPLPGTIRDLMQACRLVLEGKKDESYAIAKTFFHKHFDPEGLYFTSRVLAHLGESEVCLDMLDRIIDSGFYCSTVMWRDPWLDPVRGHSRLNGIIKRAEARTHEAEEEFRRLNGHRILGLNA